jgi:hypothetical protein
MSEGARLRVEEFSSRNNFWTKFQNKLAKLP